MTTVAKSSQKIKAKTRKTSRKLVFSQKLGFMQGFNNNNIQGDMGVEGKNRYNQDTYPKTTHGKNLHTVTAGR